MYLQLCLFYKHALLLTLETFLLRIEQDGLLSNTATDIEFLLDQLECLQLLQHNLLKFLNNGVYSISYDIP